MNKETKAQLTEFAQDIVDEINQACAGQSLSRCLVIWSDYWPYWKLVAKHPCNNAIVADILGNLEMANFIDGIIADANTDFIAEWSANNRGNE